MVMKMTEFSYFRIKDIFSQPGKGDVDLQQSDINGKGEYFINSGETNYGIKGRTDREAKIFPANTITIDFWGNAYYRDFKYKLATHNHVFSFNDSIIKNKNVGLYLVGALQFLKHKYSYSNMLTWNKLKQESVYLPVISKTNEINFKYMEDRVKALEQDRVKALANYLTVTGLNDYELTDSDREVLSYKPTFKDYKIWDIFKVVNTHSILKSQIENLSEGNTPYLTAAEGNNAVFSYINCPKEWIDEGNCVFIGGKTMVVTYQEKDFCSNDSHNLALYFKQDKYRTPLIQQYFVGAIRKSLAQKYSWGDSISKSKIKKDIISLPIDKKYNIDFQYMENYIKAVQKLTIKDVVKYKDEVIDKTKEVINIKKI
jgi:hypothetical protein